MFLAKTIGNNIKKVSPPQFYIVQRYVVVIVIVFRTQQDI